MKKNIVNIVFFGTMLVSCEKSENLGVEYVPYQETEKGQWCMISPAGEVLFSEEFKNEPTIAKDGRFMVKNDEGLWEIYTAEAKPKKVGGEYLYATCFEDGIALVAEQNGYVTIINKEGKEVKVLDKIGNKIVDEVGAFSEGYALYKTGDFIGAINREGKEIIKPDYVALNPCHDGKFIGVNMKYEKEFGKKDGKFSYDIIDTNGNILFSISNEKYSNIGSFFIDGLLPIAIKQDGEDCWGIINDKNEVIVKPTSKIKGISDISGKKFIYSNGEGYGLMNIDGENLIRAKYEMLSFDESNRLFAITEKTQKTYDYKCRLIDEEDNRIGDEEFSNYYSFKNFDGKHAFVKVGDKMWSIIDIDGKQLQKLPDMVNIGVSTGDNSIKNDHVDFAELFKEMKLGANSVDGLTLHKTTAKEAAKIREDNSPREGNSEHPVSDPYWYDVTNLLGYNKTFNKVEVKIVIGFPDFISRKVYRTQNEDYGYFTYRHEVFSGYEFNNLVGDRFAVEFSDSGILKGKSKQLLNAINEHMKMIGGKLEKSNDNAAVFTLGKDNRAISSREDNKVILVWGNLKPVEELNIDKYTNIENVSAPAEETDTIAEVVDF
ncbi:MAG: WG repeat-containing protein [Prevotella sp.]|nr:WG repeat-containing protein [Prevotella sp.]